MRHIFVSRTGVAAAFLLLFLAACGSGSPAGAGNSLGLNAAPYTPLGGVQKSTQPTASDLADLQAAESGKLDQPALVEFYADY